MLLRATTSFGLHLGSSNILLTSEQSTKLTLSYANWVYVYFVIIKNIPGSGFELYVIHLYKFSVYTKEAKTKNECQQPLNFAWCFYKLQQNVLLILICHLVSSNIL